MKKIHYTDRYLLNPYHPVTVFVIGAGGTGSQVATGLARMSVALQALGHPGLHVTVFDPDTVTEANIGRQLFSGSELGLNKAAALATRINRFFGFSWAYEEERDFYPVGMESQVMLVYSTRDTLAECMEGFMNSDYQETYALTPVTYRFLTPETDCLFQMDDYPEKLSKWLARFTKHIADNF